ncbi:MAG: hypothetical protein IJ243_09040 [Prevotella sp.]|nr:hypothetical protein [Prevotella sp.]
MDTYKVTLKMQPFVAAWLRKHYGNPVRFPDRSIESIELRRLTVGRRSASEEEACRDGLEPVDFALPDCAYHKPSVYHYLNRRGRRTLQSMTDDLFQIDLYHGIESIVAEGGTLVDAIWTWCRRNDIHPDFTGTIRQRFYRARESHRSCGVQLSLAGKVTGRKKS